MENINNKEKSMDDNTMLAPVSRTYLEKGDKVKTKSGEVLTVKWLEYTDIICEERVGYVPKKDILTVLE